MKPRTAPTRPAAIQLALDELNRYGLLQQYIPAMVDVAVYWKEVKKKGLPAGEPDRLTVIVEGEGERAEWKIYVVTQGSIRMGFAESLDGATLYLMLIVSARDMTIRQAVAETCNRL